MKEEIHRPSLNIWELATLRNLLDSDIKDYRKLLKWHLHDASMPVDTIKWALKKKRRLLRKLNLYLK